jgi:hypothetical protein
MAKLDAHKPPGSDQAAKNLSSLVHHLEKTLSSDPTRYLDSQNPNATYERQRLKAVSWKTPSSSLVFWVRGIIG